MNDLPTGPIVPRPAPPGAFDAVLAKARHRRRVRVVTLTGLVAAALVLVAIPTVVSRFDTSDRKLQVGVTASDGAVRSSTVPSSTASTTSTTATSAPSTSTTTTTIPTDPPLGTVEMGGAALPDYELALPQQVHDALAANDQAALDRLLDPELDPTIRAERLRDLSDPAIRAAALLALSTHPAATDGLTYPGFMLGCFETPAAAEDGRRLGIDVPADAGTFDTQYCDLQQHYNGVVLTFDANVGTDRGTTWLGADPYQPYLFPDSTFQQAQEAQSAVDQGHQPWRQDPTSVASSYGGSLGWTNTTVTQVDANVYDVTNSDGSTRLRLKMTQPIRQDQTGIWEIVTATPV